MVQDIIGILLGAALIVLGGVVFWRQPITVGDRFAVNGVVAIGLVAVGALAAAGESILELAGFTLFLFLWATLDYASCRIWPQERIEGDDAYFRRVIWPSFGLSMIAAGAISAAVYALIFAD